VNDAYRTLTGVGPHDKWPLWAEDMETRVNPVTNEQYWNVNLTCKVNDPINRAFFHKVVSITMQELRQVRRL
jgi:hypothetical protein